MINDFLDYDSEAPIDCDVCIAGAGAAGISIARSLAGTSLKVVLLEAGGVDYEEDSQAIYEGTIVGHPYYDLDVTRLRYFGGSTNHWAGQCTTLDPIDMEVRPWVPHSGWPFDRASLDPWYEQAQGVIGIGAYAYDHQALSPEGTPFLDLADDKLRHKLWRFNDPPTRFGERYQAELEAAANVDVWLHANLVDIETGSNGSEVTGFKISTLDGRTARVRAKRFVLALGGMENPRLLLNSIGANPAGLGNDRDLVGRYFIDHMNGVVGQVAGVQADWGDAYNFLQSDEVRIRTKVRASPTVQAERGLLNGAAQLGQKPTARDSSPGYKALRRIRDNVKKGEYTENLGANVVAIATDIDGIWDGMVEYFVDENVYIEVEAEQAPNPDSRIMLGDERDRLGLRKLVFDWRLGDIDRHSIEGLVQLIGEEVGRLGVGRVEVEPWLMEEGAWPDENFGGHHHSGTTRMADDPSKGVVDADCRLFGVDNLYIAGSSVFPTIGGANPTLTITALALRLADHIRTSMEQA